MKRFLNQLLRKIIIYPANFQQGGFALVITLLAMMVLVLLALALVLQSNTEHMISVNEQDSFQALSEGEAALNWGDRIVRDWIEAQTTSPSNLTPILTGLAGTTPGVNNFLGFRAYDSTKDRFTLVDENTSGIQSYGGLNWEVFRIAGPTSNTKAVIYARVDDNYDEGTGAFPDANDLDLRLRLTIHAFYPVYVKGDGTENTDIKIRPQAHRTIVGRFWPGGTYAIRTEGDLELWGTSQVCGECGATHANGLMRAARTGADNIDICGEATGTGSFEWNGGTIVGDKGISPEVYIPVINPYEYIPAQTLFNQTLTLRDASPGPIYQLTCPQPSATDPGSSKYFALVRNTSGPNRMAQVWKAYPDTSNPSRWYWRLIDERWEPGNPAGGSTINQAFNAVLDNCGRVVTCTAALGCTGDQIETSPGVWSGPLGGGVTDGGDSEFYGWAPAANFGTASCSGDNINVIDLAPDNKNNWTTNDFQYVTGSAPITLSGTGSRISSRICPGETCPGVPALPGTEGEDGTPDFVTSTYVTTAGWNTSGNTVYSPMYGAVVFIYGNVDLTGNLGNITFNTGVCGATGCATGAQVTIADSEADPPDSWPVTVIATGHADIGGNVRHMPAFGNINTFQYTLVSGRDIRMHGTTNSFGCNSADCDGAPTGTDPGYSGIVVCHEQADFEGNVGVNGFIIPESRVDCDNFVSPSGGNLANQGHGSIQIHYNCTDPIDPWAAKGVAMKEWEEVQR